MACGGIACAVAVAIACAMAPEGLRCVNAPDMIRIWPYCMRLWSGGLALAYGPPEGLRCTAYAGGHTPEGLRHCL